MVPEYMCADQRFAARRPDVLVYESDVLAKDVTLAGPIAVELHVSTTGTDSDWVVKLIDVYPDDYPDPMPEPDRRCRLGGYQQLVRGEVMRGRFRNSFEKPEPFEPGQPTAVRFSCPTCATRSARATRSWCRSRAAGSRSWSATRRRSWTSPPRRNPTSARRRSASTDRRNCRRGSSSGAALMLRAFQTVIYTGSPPRINWNSCHSTAPA